MRIYPITLRYMQQPFSHYTWIEADVERNESDFRPESFRVKQDGIQNLEHLDTKDGWKARSEWVLRSGNVFSSVEALQAAELKDHTSLGLVKPKIIRRFYARKKSAEDRKEWEEHRDVALKQRDLFVDTETKTKDLVFMPVQYRVVFTCDDAACRTEHDFSILDWGIYVLSRKMYAQRGASGAERAVIDKLEELMNPEAHEPYLFLGNTKAHSHNFMAVGLYYPPREVAKASKPDPQMTLFR
ncbi:hypothetical protein JY651_30575 [Pyxidicoccus parkwayensis]|uniref:Uncharacterized protein n=1 Tax=Pyxidicoccus parkwayensis TaxID=2813578 RepID=A0ABX7NMQ8_9BACT|nr:hypothetical protein [Pyxidicoccus parkwaysis]QSQ19644.1 hypothetical protein JY651_30575 [Pyxidicoccus parkwaysis]